MAKPDMKKTVEETFEKKDEGIEELLKKPRSKLTDEEKERVEDYHLDSSDPYPQKETSAPRKKETSAPRKKPDVAMAARSASSASGERMPSLAERTASKSLDTLTRFGEEVADLPAEAYQAMIESSARDKRRLEGQKQRHHDMWMRQHQIAVDGHRQAPGQAPRTDAQWEQLIRITDEIENLENRRSISMNPERARLLEEEIQMLTERRRKMPGGRNYDLRDSDLTDEGATTNYEDYLLRE